MENFELELRKKGYSFRRRTPDGEGRRENKNLVFDDLKEAIVAKEYIDKQLKGIDVPLKAIRNRQEISIRPIEFGKGQISLKIAEILGIVTKQVLAIGDSQNDEDMLDGQFGFKCTTTGNAETYIKRVVTKNNGYVATQPYGKGVAEILRKFY